MHGSGNDPAEIVGQACKSEIDLIAITDHQAFNSYEKIAKEAEEAEHPLTVLPGIEITSNEGVHVLAIFPENHSTDSQKHLIGWLEIPGTGDTKIASKKQLSDIFDKVAKENGIIVAPHPLSSDTGLLDGARKLSTKVDWLESGHVRLMQIAENRVKFIEQNDKRDWVNRYVLESAQPQDIYSSTYCLAPFNRSDAHKPEEIYKGCSWFRMEQPSVEGLKQVACEPHTRISRIPPTAFDKTIILGMRVVGGYCHGQIFKFNDCLNCIIGQNYAGKSAVFDFIRFALAHEDDLPQDSRDKLLKRLFAILKVDGSVELFLRDQDNFYVIKRAFKPDTSGEGPELKVLRCNDIPITYKFNPEDNQLNPVTDLKFNVEVYEQGRINRLRDEVSRQLEMLDEIANLESLKNEKVKTIANLNDSANKLAPLYIDREQIQSEVASLPDLKKELSNKSKLLPSEEVEKKWTKAGEIIETLVTTTSELHSCLENIPNPKTDDLTERQTELECLFGHHVPEIDRNKIVHADLITKWCTEYNNALEVIEKTRVTIVETIRNYTTRSDILKNTWDEAYREREKEVSAHLSKEGIESPSELIQRVNELRSKIRNIRKQLEPRLNKINKIILQEESIREALLVKLESLDEEIREKRQENAEALTITLGGQIKISLEVGKDCKDYQNILKDLCDKITDHDRRIHSRDAQIKQIVTSISPLNLSRALSNNGILKHSNGKGKETSLLELCGITEHTQNVLCRISENIELLNRLQTASPLDVPRILVRRHGESTYADLRTGLSPGEQSAAILTLALQTRSMPLILDQPEDELGYSYVVNLVVPKILQAKFSRQLIIITHNANIPVLGDSDYVIKMENRPHEINGRECIVTQEGGFESTSVTESLVELEGGKQAFQFRQHRYSLS